ncbi:hypothetical protein KSP40_PGU006675 [Platanthera guangdongensis]|uniref:Stress-response A/B barrel domain-containing protein n=1 Tax=Platanthera guangdongensis TaxID=2320717 RepID=A0ABR2LCX6_9ASPA
MLNLKTFTYLHRAVCLSKPPLPSSFPPPILPRRFLPLRLAVAGATSSSVSTFSSSSTANISPISVVEHVVLFKVRDSTDPSLTEAMIANLRSLTSLGIASYLTAGPILRRRSSAAEAFGFTHLLFSRYSSKNDLATYSAHPSHLAVVKENVLPICDDIMAVDWIAEVDVDAAPLPGSLVRLTLAKPQVGTAAAELVKAIDGIRGTVPDSVQVSYGENFSPARAKGYEFGFISAFPGLDEAEAIEGNEEVEKQKEKVRPLLESAVVLDYLVPSPVSCI